MKNFFLFFQGINDLKNYNLTKWWGWANLGIIVGLLAASGVLLVAVGGWISERPVEKQARRGGYTAAAQVAALSMLSPAKKTEKPAQKKPVANKTTAKEVSLPAVQRIAPLVMLCDTLPPCTPPSAAPEGFVAGWDAQDCVGRQDWRSLACALDYLGHWPKGVGPAYCCSAREPVDRVLVSLRWNYGKLTAAYKSKDALIPKSGVLRENYAVYDEYDCKPDGAPLDILSSVRNLDFTEFSGVEDSVDTAKTPQDNCTTALAEARDSIEFWKGQYETLEVSSADQITFLLDSLAKMQEKQQDGKNDNLKDSAAFADLQPSCVLGDSVGRLQFTITGLGKHDKTQFVRLVGLGGYAAMTYVFPNRFQMGGEAGMLNRSFLGHALGKHDSLVYTTPYGLVGAGLNVGKKLRFNVLAQVGAFLTQYGAGSVDSAKSRIRPMAQVRVQTSWKKFSGNVIATYQMSQYTQLEAYGLMHTTLFKDVQVGIGPWGQYARRYTGVNDVRMTDDDSGILGARGEVCWHGKRWVATLFAQGGVDAKSLWEREFAPATIFVAGASATFALHKK